MSLGEPEGTFSAPWHNRPSVIAAWEHSVSGVDLTGTFFSDLSTLITQNNLTTNVAVGGNPICIPRACRMTRVCINLRFGDFELPPDNQITLEINRSIAECETAGYETAFSHTFSLLNSGFELNCDCFDTGGILFNKCDQWYPTLFLPTDRIERPLFRILFHFELR